MSTRISVDEISLYRKGSDIDLQAIFGGRISQKKFKDLKVNPVYTDGILAQNSKQLANGGLNGIHVETYETFPRVGRERGKLQPTSSGGGLTNNEKNGMKNQNSKDAKEKKVNMYTSDSECSNGSTHLWHINGGVTGKYLNGHISHKISYPKNGFRNPAFDMNDDVEVVFVDSTEGNTKLGKTQSQNQQMENSDREVTVVSNKIVTEVHVHKEDVEKESDSQSDSLSKNISDRDWPDLDEIAVPVEDVNANTVSLSEDINSNSVSLSDKNSISVEMVSVHVNPTNKKADEIQKVSPNPVSEKQTTVIEVSFETEKLQNSSQNEVKSMDTDQIQTESGSVSKEIVQEVHKDGDAQLMDKSSTPNCSSRSSSESSQSENEKSSSKNDPDTTKSKISRKSIKSILSHSEDHHGIAKHKSHGESSSKAVKFSDDTVFHENKPTLKRQTTEFIALKDIYKGKFGNNSAMAKLNPLFSDDPEDKQHSLTDDEKMLMTSLYKKIENVDKVGLDGLPSGMEFPVYDRLIQRTLAKQRRKLVIKWTLIILTVLIITGVATVLGVYFGNKSSF